MILIIETRFLFRVKECKRRQEKRGEHQARVKMQLTFISRPVRPPITERDEGFYWCMRVCVCARCDPWRG